MELGSEPRPISSLGQALSVRDALAKSGAPAALDWLVWSPEADPTSFQSSKVQIEKKTADGNFSGQLTLGPLQARVEFLPDGSSRRAELDAAGQPLVIERVHTEGKF